MTTEAYHHNQETWKPVVGFEGFYEVSDLGRVRRSAYAKGTWVGRIRKTTVSSWGYSTLRLCAHGRGKSVNVHHLVVDAFISTDRVGLDINHKNGIKTDNRLCNLEIVTRAENIQHAYMIGLMNNCGPGRLTEDDVREIKANQENLSQRPLAKKFGVSQPLISQIQSGKIWKRVK